MNADDTPRNTYQDDTRWLEAERRTDATLFRRNLLVAVLVFGLAFAFFAKTVLARYAVPGQSADFVALATGLRVNFSFRFAVWRRLLAGFVALSVRLRLDRSTPEAVDAKMREYAARRFDFRGLRTCGSVFRNPPPPAPPAGKLADDAGCKGLRVGGARVSERHANVIAADPDATASDVLALVDLVRSRVLAASGVDLVPEIRVLR